MVGLAACDTVKDNLLEAVEPDDHRSVVRAVGRRRDRRSQRRAVAPPHRDRRRREHAGCSAACWSTNGRTSSTFVQNDETDQRQISAEQLDGQRRAPRALSRAHVGEPGDRPAQQVQADAGVGHRRDVFRSRIRRAAVGVGLLQRHSAQRWRGRRRSRSASRCRSRTCSPSRRVVRHGDDAAAPATDAASVRSTARRGSARRVRCLGMGLSNAAAAAALVTGDSDELPLRRHGVADRRHQHALGSADQPEPLHGR